MDTCKSCNAWGNHHLTLEDGEQIHLCDDCYNAWFCERLGLDYGLYKHPKSISVLGKRFMVRMDIFVSGVAYFAYRGKGKRLESICFVGSFLMSGAEAMKELRSKVAFRTFRPTMEEGMLNDMGSVGIVENDQNSDELDFLIDGKRYSEEEFLDLLRIHSGSNLVYLLEQRVPNPDSEWVTLAEHLPKGIAGDEEDLWDDLPDWDDPDWEDEDL